VSTYARGVHTPVIWFNVVAPSVIRTLVMPISRSTSSLSFSWKKEVAWDDDDDAWDCWAPTVEQTKN
jgi:hypothetical protein